MKKYNENRLAVTFTGNETEREVTMVLKGRAVPKFITLLICAALVFTTIPFSAMEIVQAAEKNPQELEITETGVNAGPGESVKFYIHGVTEATAQDSENYSYRIKVEGVEDTSQINVYVNGNKNNEATASGNVKYEQDVISVSQSWANQQVGWIAISLGKEAVLDEADKNEIKAHINGCVKSDLEYTGGAQDLLNDSQESGWSIKYSLNEDGTFSDDVPQGTNAGDYNIYFKATKDGYETYADSVKASIAQQKIDNGLSFAETTQKKEYNITSQQITLQEVTVNDKNLNVTNISYKVKDNSANTAGAEVDPANKILTYTSPGEVTIEAFMSGGNYAATAEYKLVIAAIEVNDLAFSGIPERITVNKNNTFQYPATSATDGVNVEYALSAETEGKTGAAIDKDTGIVTYESAGKITVTAKPVSPYDGKEATYTVEVVYDDVDIILSSNGTENVKRNGKWYSNGTFEISTTDHNVKLLKRTDEMAEKSVIEASQDDSITWNSETLATEETKTNINGEYYVVFQDDEGNLTDWIDVNRNNRDSEGNNDWKFATDKYAPTVSFSYETEGMDKAEIMTEESAPLKETKYGYFFKEAVEVTITSDDIQSTEEVSLPGVAGGRIVYRLVDKDGTSDEGWQDIEVKDNKITVKIDKGFKGQIEAYAIDELGNTRGETEVKHPQGIIWENEEKHLETSAIQFSAPETDFTQTKKFAGYVYPNSMIKRDVNNGGLSENGYEDFGGAGDDVSLYASKNGTIKFDICVKDEYSGIAQIRCAVLETEAEKSTVPGTFDYTLTVNKQGDISSSDDNVKTEATKDRNLISKLVFKDFEVSGGSNDMVILVELTDNSGNISYDYYAFGIDNEKPVVEVDYDPASGDEDNNGYFNKNRTATITVYDRNFDPDDAENTTLSVTKDKKAYDFGALKWKATGIKGGEGNDEDCYETTVTFKEDGDYTFDVKVNDRAENENDNVKYADDNKATTVFTIDKTNPRVSVRYDNNSASNGKYFDRVRTATVTVQEHNFDVNRVTFDIRATLDGANISQPNINWARSSGDTHTATVAYRADGDYTFNIEVEDKAGNKNNGVSYVSGTVAGAQFTIDTEINEPFITGVEDGNSYKGTVIPVIDLDDVNYDSHDIVLLRTRKDEQNVNVTSKYIGGLARDGHGGTITCNTFEEIQENDGIYKLTVSMVDKAGNRSEKSITFTVNRFGSVYDYNEYLSSLQDQYVKQVTRNIVITEYNPDRLVEGSLELEITKDGTPLKNPEYSVTPVINSSAPIGSSGWYQYEYDIAASNFAKDGVYSITVASEDEVGNKPETSNYEELDAMFRVDSVAPEFTSIKGLEESIVNADEQKVTFDVFDAIGLDKVTVYVDGKKVKNIDKFDDLSNCSDDFIVHGGLKQDVRLVAEDKAGNVMDTSSEEFKPAYEFNDTITVSTNIFVRWFANTWLFIGSLIALAAVTGGIIAFVKRRKGKEAISEDM